LNVIYFAAQNIVNLKKKPPHSSKRKQKENKIYRSKRPDVQFRDRMTQKQGKGKYASLLGKFIAVLRERTDCLKPNCTLIRAQPFEYLQGMLLMAHSLEFHYVTPMHLLSIAFKSYKTLLNSMAR